MMKGTLCRLLALLIGAGAGLMSPSSVFSQESVVVRAKLVQGDLPTDPTAAVWNTLPVTEFPLSPQVHWQKRIQQVTVKSIKVRAVHNNRQIAFLLEYADPTQDPADAAALEFMVGRKRRILRMDSRWRRYKVARSI